MISAAPRHESFHHLHLRCCDCCLRRPGCRRPHRHSFGSVRSRIVMEQNSLGSARNRSVTELNSCGSVRNKSAAPSTSEWAADCKSAAARNRDCRRTACCYMPVAEARKRGRCWKSLGGCRCRLASKAARTVRRRLQTATRLVPTVDDSHHSCALLAWVGSRGDSSFRNPPVGGHHH